MNVLDIIFEIYVFLYFFYKIEIIEQLFLIIFINIKKKYMKMLTFSIQIYF